MNQELRRQLLADLDFGRVDAESVEDLDQRFLRTQDFDKLIESDISLILGPKGSGKSTIFELFGRFGPFARSLAGGMLDDVVFVTGVGFLDSSELGTEEIASLRSEGQYDHERLWALYIALKVALALESNQAKSSGPVRDLLRVSGHLRDIRLLPMLQALWRALIGPSPRRDVRLGIAGVSFELGSENLHRIDIHDVLQDAHEILEATGKRLWILFDKVDELFPRDRAERKATLEGLLGATMALRRAYPRIRPRVFLRTDIWSQLDFTNKSHLLDKMIRLRWNKVQIAALLVKGAATAPSIEREIRRAVPEFDADRADEQRGATVRKAFRALVSKQVTVRRRNFDTLDWMYGRIQDGHGDAFPREAIFWCNLAVEQERNRHVAASPEAPLVGGQALASNFSNVSVARCETYLAEFPHLREHFARFEGTAGPSFTREELTELMGGLDPAGLEMLRSLHEVGILTPLRGNVSTAPRFEIPLLYRSGLGLATKERV